MRVTSAFMLLFGLFIALVSAKAKLSDAWDIDASCDSRREQLDNSFSDLVEMVRKARMDLFRVQEPKLQRKTQSYLSDVNWDRIARNLAVIFGLKPPEDPTKNGFDPEEEHFNKVNYTIGRMYGGLVQGDAMPEGGFSTKLQNLNKKPLIMCGDRNWEFRRRRQGDKYERFRTVEQVFPELQGNAFEGAYIHEYRYLRGWAALQTPQICIGGVYGVTLQRHDLITFCDSAFEFPDEKSPVRDADQVTIGTKLDDDRFGFNTLTRVMLHEFAHYYGTVVPENYNGNADQLERGKLKDVPAVDKNGCKLWKDAKGGFTREKQNEDSQVVYTFQLVTNIARDQTGNEHAGQWRRDQKGRPDDWEEGERGDSGPHMATRTAETYAYFAILSYMDGWDWTSDGIARELPKVAESAGRPDDD
ncbi:hypothetical protein NM208_g5584 [Fusarium decemcellulare]|uniref:Uncharacterized protein n=1 Tax=Fusarium decemcellulare TaxID=57161 RepID=A0ACC1SGH6_9HYPO|nr:hypothetical protein NM208_g5584 [Fusarium decemcellulare]